jgi:hypothetical protein
MLNSKTVGCSYCEIPEAVIPAVTVSARIWAERPLKGSTSNSRIELGSAVVCRWCDNGADHSVVKSRLYFLSFLPPLILPDAHFIIV